MKLICLKTDTDPTRLFYDKYFTKNEIYEYSHMFITTNPLPYRTFNKMVMSHTKLLRDLKKGYFAILADDEIIDEKFKKYILHEDDDEQEFELDFDE